MTASEPQHTRGDRPAPAERDGDRPPDAAPVETTEELKGLFNHYVLRTITDNATLALFLMDSRQHCTFMNPPTTASSQKRTRR
jgi:hypothetical protein